MVSVQHSESTTELQLTPNRSLSWRGNLRVLAGLCLFIGIIVTAWTFAGAWVVVPFAGLELGALAVALYVTALRCRQRERLLFDEHTLIVEKGIYHRQAQWHWPRRYTRACVQAARHPWTSPNLLLCHRDERVPLGHFLNREDMSELIGQLRRLGVVIDACSPD